MGDARRSLAAAFGLAWRADRARVAAVAGLTLVTSLTGVAVAWSLKVLVDAAGRGDEGGALVAAAAVAAVAGGTMLASAVTTRMMFLLRENTALRLDRALVDLVAGPPTVDHHERPDQLARIDVLRREGHVLASAAVTITGAAAVVVEAVATGALLAWVDPVLLAIPLFALPSLWAGTRAETLRRDALERTADDARQVRHLFELATTPVPAKEVRVFGLGPELLRRHAAGWRRTDRALDRAAVLATLWTAWGWLFFTVGYAGAVALVVRGAVQGTASAGDVVLALVMIAQVNDQVAGAVGSVTDLARVVAVASRLVWLRDLARQGARRAGTAPAPERLRQGIELRGVRFRYAGTDVDVLRGVDLSIPAGATVAVVGENGAGKSTLVKLLCGLHEPSSGAVLVDGVDLAHIEPASWQSRVSAAFQDFARLELLALQSVGVGDLPHLDDRPAVAAALARAGSADVAERLPRGLDTPLGASFDDGAELSGGQWQRLALARAMMRPAPLLLVLDEPTASLDAAAESALFVRYAAAARDRAGSGAVTLLVSHRFSTVHMADLIVVLDRGQVVEAGSHAGLMAAGGLYAELHELQARGYR